MDKNRYKSTRSLDASTFRRSTSSSVGVRTSTDDVLTPTDDDVDIRNVKASKDLDRLVSILVHSLLPGNHSSV